MQNPHETNIEEWELNSIKIRYKKYLWGDLLP